MLRRLTSLFSKKENDLRCVGAYHKAGTVWLNGIFREVAEELTWDFAEVESDTDHVVDEPAILFNHSSRFPEFLFERPVLGVRIIRDPRDMVISGAHYHGRGAEDWLKEGQDIFNGKSYCEMINSLGSLQEKYRFEMRHTASYVIRQMVHADHNEALYRFIEKNFLTIRYENLIDDQDLVEVGKICDNLKLPRDVVGPAFVRNSLFGEKKKDTQHIRSGKTQQWKTEFDRRTAEEFSSLHQEALEVLGYEENSDWVRQL